MDRNSDKFRSPFLRPNAHLMAASSEKHVPHLPSSKTLKGIIAGGITGGLEICITFPTEYVKTQLQLDEKLGAQKRYKGPIDCVKVTVREYGVRGLYRGLSVLLYGSIPKSAVRFGSFEEFKKQMVGANGTLNAHQRLLCGLGIRGCYQGLTATMMKQGSNQAIRFFVMETLKDWYRGEDKHMKVPTLVTGLFGAIAGTASVYGNTPIDVIKTRMQGLEAAKYKNTWDCAKQIMKNEGPRAFYKGTVPRLSRVTLDVAITFMIYDNFMHYFNMVWKT